MVDFSLSRDLLLLRLCLLHLLFSSPSQTPCELLSSSGVYEGVDEHQMMTKAHMAFGKVS
jgi:hypothetical protein